MALVDLVKAVRKWVRPGGNVDVTSVRANTDSTKPSGKNQTLLPVAGSLVTTQRSCFMRLPTQALEKLSVESGHGPDLAEE